MASSNAWLLNVGDRHQHRRTAALEPRAENRAVIQIR
jgi:hypothetical protein